MNILGYVEKGNDKGDYCGVLDGRGVDGFEKIEEKLKMRIYVRIGGEVRMVGVFYVYMYVVLKKYFVWWV